MSKQTAQLLVQLQGVVVQSILLHLPVLRIGRDPENGLVLNNHMISRRHAEIRVGEQGITLTDLGSSNGTFIGNQRLLPHQPRLLIDGASFRVGPYQLIYRASAVDAEEGTLPVSEDLPPPLPEPVETRKQVSEPPRPTLPTRRPPESEPVSIYMRHLPDIYQENDFLQRFLRIFEDIWEPLEQRQDHIAMYFDPHTCPVAFLPWLASWLDIPLPPHWPEARKRGLLAQAMELYSWRGTSYGLARMIEICTGLTAVITDHPSQPFVFHISLTLPPGSSLSGKTLDRDFINDLIQTHKPAYAGYILEVNI